MTTPITPTATAVPRVLYQTDWANSAGSWTLSDGWSITSAGLANTGKGDANLSVPYTPTVANYTITIALQMMALVDPHACERVFGLEGQTLAGAVVYDADVDCIDNQTHGFMNFYASNVDGQFYTADDAVGYSVRHYVINVQGRYVTDTNSGDYLGMIVCDQPTAPNRLVLLNAGVATVISSITITTP